MPRFVHLPILLACIVASQSYAQEPKKPTPFELDPAHAQKMKASAELFGKSVRATLAAKCLKCHGGQEKIESLFDIGTRESLLKGGEYGEHDVIPGDAKGSFLVKVVSHAEEPKMPAKADKLTDSEIASIVQWIDLGAAYDKPLVEKNEDPLAWTKKKIDVAAAREHWSLKPLGKHQPPRINSPWIRTPIDYFIYHKLRQQGLEPNKHADKRTLLRRATFDLIGLPPTPEELAAFLADDSPAAYEKVIDRLLASQHFGERWARHWLDVARFAESHGFEQDYDRPYAYVFRDFVIQAFNEDMPFDQFVRWQLAGDEFEPENPLALNVTGFLGAGVFPTQITANEVERTRYDAIDDMAATTGTAMLGLTIGCARCHDHKFDPIPQTDYYRFASTFTTAVRSDQDVNIDPAGYKTALADFENEHTPLVAALQKFDAEQLPARFAAWEKEHSADAAKASWIILDPAEAKSSGGATLTKQDDGSLLASGTKADFDTYTFVAATNLRDITGIKLEALAHPSLVKGGPGRADNGNFDLTDFRVSAQPADGKALAVELKLQNARATFEQKPNLLVADAIDVDKKSGWAVDPQFGKDHAAVFDLAEPINLDGGTKLFFKLEFKGNNKHNIGRVRLSVTTKPTPASLDGLVATQQVVEALTLAADKRSPEQITAILKWYAPQDAEWQKLNQIVQDHFVKTPKPKLVKMMIVSEGVTPIRHHTQGADFFKEYYFAHRGDSTQKCGVATQSFLQALITAADGEKHWQVPPPAGAHTSYRRRALANWITDTEYGAGQLLARVIVNRLWQHHIGQGVVATPNDFGKQGVPPSHPELLDYLANDLIEHGWQLKRLHKQIMLSAVYQQTSEFSAEKQKLDEANKYCWRYAPRRLEAEVIRDSLLATSGELDRTMYGAGTLDEGHKRRSIYFMVKRSRLIPMMTLFDAPEPLVSVGSRPATTIAPQALALMNNPHVRQWAKSFGKQLVPFAEKSTADAAKHGYLAAIARQPDEQELSDSVAFIDGQIASYGLSNKDTARELALADFAQVLLSLNEFVFID